MFHAKTETRFNRSRSALNLNVGRHAKLGAALLLAIFSTTNPRLCAQSAQPDAVFCDATSDETAVVGMPWNPKGVYGGDGSGAYQYSMDGGKTWTSDNQTFSTAGTYEFYVRRMGDSLYNTSPMYGAYSVVVANDPALMAANLVDQPDPVFCDDSTMETTTVNTPWNPLGIYGGDGIGAYEYSLDGGATWTSGSFAFQAAGTYTFVVHRRGDGQYTDSQIFGTYTVTVI